MGGTAQPKSASAAPQIRDLVGYFLRLGTLGFGGPVALCGLMEKELVQDRGWLTKQEMRDAIAVSQSLPGPSLSRLGFLPPIFAVASGAPGQAVGLLFSLIS